MKIRTLLKYVFLSALRDKFFLSLFVVIFAVFGVSNLIGFTATTEEALMQTVIFGGIIRLVIVFGMTIFISFYIGRSFENKEISFILSKSISREKFIFSYWIAFNLISFILILLFSVIFFLLCKYDLYGSLQWICSIVLELMVISMFAILASFVFENAVFSVFATTGFYVVSRLMGFFINTNVISVENEFLNFLFNTSHILLKFVSSLIPRLDLFGQTKWLIYGGDLGTLKIVLIQSAIYIVIMFMMAFYDFKKKQF